MALVLQGLGAVPLYILGITYLDEASPPATASLHMGTRPATFVLILLCLVITPSLFHSELKTTHSKEAF